jgi:hypothetical protein
MTTINALDNPAMASQMIDQVMSTVHDDAPEQEEIEVDLAGPEDLVFDLPSGYLSMTGEVVKEVEVRELTGRDEEALSRLKSVDKMLQELLVRGTVRIGQDKPTESLLDQMLSGDRDYILLRIYAATFGSSITATPWCPSCDKVVEKEVDLLNDVEIKTLDSPFDRRVRVDTSRGQVIADLPNGTVQKKMIAAVGKSVTELSSVLLSGTVTEINGMSVFNPAQVLDLPIKDRRKISEAIVSHLPGPQLQSIKVACDDCNSELEVPLSLAALFQFP